MSNTTVNKGLITTAKTAMLSAMIIVLSFLESMLPDFPFVLPGMKLGISNIALLLAVELCPLPSVLCIAIVKALFALISRGATAFFMSLAGSLLAALVMYAAVHIKKPRFGNLGIGVLGAFAHNCGQLAVALLLVGKAVLWYFPVMALFAVITGALTGLACHIALPAVLKVRIFR